MESRVLPSTEISAILTSKFVCLKVDADNPGDAEKMLSQVKGNILPFYAYVTPEGKFISGTSGFRSEKVFKADLEGVLKSDLMKVAPDAEKKLAKLADQAAKDLEARKLQAVFKAARDADTVRGVSESKDKIKELAGQAVQLGMQRITEACDLCRDAKFDEAGAILSALVKEFKGTDVEPAAIAANKAVDHFKSAAKALEKEDKAGAKKQFDLVVKECKDVAAFLELAESKLKEIAP
jgi:hypothetical protein